MIVYEISICIVLTIDLPKNLKVLFSKTALFDLNENKRMELYRTTKHENA